MKIWFILLSCVAIVYGQDDTCPAFGDWLPQTENCLWFPLTQMRQDMLDACGIEFDASQLPTPPSMPANIMSQLPEKCGHCSFKFQCRKRAASKGCFPIEGKHEQCSDFPEVCEMPKAPVVNNCKWGSLIEMMKQCINRPSDELPEWEREAYKGFGKMAPEMNCEEKGDKCACCCHPFKPSADGSSCEPVPEQQCSEYGAWNDWSECMWGMPQQIVGDFREHCSIGATQGTEVTDNVDLPLPEGFEMPDKCGYCSFRVRCRKRDRADQNGKPRCFPVEAEKKACGAEDCPTCAGVCSLPKIKDSCDYGGHIRKFLKSKLSKIDKMPYWRKKGMMGIAKNLPLGNCVEIDGQCKCCCHPYAPNAEGTACEIKTFCRTPAESGLDIFGDSSRFF